MIQGSVEKIRVKRQESCTSCHGTGTKNQMKAPKCTVCNGNGVQETVQRSPFGLMKSVHQCTKCHGTGEIIADPCGSCRGKKVQTVSVDLSITIPAGVDDDTVLKIRGEGNLDKNGNRGDLIIHVKVIKDSRFDRLGSDIHSSYDIDYFDAILGTTIKVETVDGKHDVVVPSGIQPGQKLRIKSKGIPKLGGGVRGDHVVTIQITIPKAVSDKEKEYLQQIASLEKVRFGS